MAKKKRKEKELKPLLSPEDQKIQRAIILRTNRSMLILNRALRRRTGRPIGMHLDLRDEDFVRQLAHMR